MLFWLQLKWLTVKLAVVTTKHGIRRAAAIGKKYLWSKTGRAAKRVRAAKKKAGRSAKDAIIPSLPGVSKVKLPNPPISHLLRSNIPPTESEEILIRDAIKQAQTEASRLEELLTQRAANRQSSRAWETVTRHKIGQANRFVRQHKGLVSPMRRLPPEIIQEVFLWIVPGVQQTPSRWRWNVDLPWRIGQVCRSWRVNALAVSSLWTHMPVIQLKKSNAKTRLQLQYLRELLRRSRVAPLDMYIYARSFERDKHPVIDLLCSHAERWETVTVELAPTTLAGFHSIKGRLSSLKSLTLQTRPARETDHPVDLFEVAPSLQTVSVGGPSFSDIVLPFAQLVHYKERLIWGNRIHQVISSPLLESLTVLELTDEAVFPAVTIPHLTILHVKFQYRPQRNCFDDLVLPIIEDIRVVTYRGNIMGSLIRMLSKSGSPCPLKKLCVRSEFIGPNEMTSLLVLTPALVRMDITVPSYPQEFINLAAGYRGRPLAPLLETCNFYLEDLVSSQICEALSTFGSTRCGTLAAKEMENTGLLLPGELRPLKSLTVYFDGSDWSYSQQSLLEHWSPSPISEELNGLREQLHAKFPELGYGRPTTRQRKFDLMWNEKVNRILSNIDNIEVDDVVQIYHSRVHLALKSLAESKLAPFCDRSKSILDKWQPLFEKSLKDRHWAFKGPFAMAYVSDNDPLRMSAEDAMTIVFGLKEPTTFTSAFWPMFMARWP
ncbi:hypothetical protein GALMADRAFT_258052 [Galerina marginata CBS 339.88]|uniref:F-box domain-containing protein n=1 Tax=Galerina marginata (strain CBS 339.88) TaxID=685588 RepID=A0A067SC04_GALM3|nr:hypothetical protein GALMADRAFT_258052 [Galerina marginata CBS 339.88]